MDLQALLDKWLEDHPEYQKYIEAFYVISEGEDMPEAATHSLTFMSLRSGARRLTVAIDVATPYAGLIDSLLALAATQPGS